MSGWDTADVTSARLHLDELLPSDVSSNKQHHQPNDALLLDIPRHVVLDYFQRFILHHRDRDGLTFPYRDQLKANYTQNVFTIEIDCGDLDAFGQTVARVPLIDVVRKRPGDAMPLFEEAAKQVAKQVCAIQPGENVKDIQVTLANLPSPIDIRHLKSAHVAQLVTVRGIVVSAGRPRIKATNLAIMCRNCKTQRFLKPSSGFGMVTLPRVCDTKPAEGVGIPKCPLDPFVILPDATECVDQQRLKLQEAPEDVPTGELPRNISVALERNLVGQVKPGSRITIIGIYATYEAQGRSEENRTGASGVGIRIPYLRAFGISNDNSASHVLAGHFTPEEEQEMLRLSKEPQLFEKIRSSIAPAIYDSGDIANIKKALACQLFGGSRKELPDGLRLRGDINVLLLGDPSVAKSQLLKFMAEVAPIAVYTSGKGSSAAGLTASVIRDPSSGEFHLEGGALVLADGGLVCIDEFDKMREEDRVAIHEAMEQQTISIAKAGITTILNSRASVLAAANPVFGRYDDMKSPTEQIEFQASILSRFDMLFIVRDMYDPVRDRLLAQHIINVHRQRDDAVTEASKLGIIPINTLKKYVAYARRHCAPRLNVTAAETLKSYYQNTRQKVNGKSNGSIITITIRHLEAIIRIAEARARMELQDEVNEEHLADAIMLFEVSTMRAASAGITDGGVASSDFDKYCRLATTAIEQRLAIGATTNVASLIRQLKEHGHKDLPLKKAIDNLQKSGSVSIKNQGKLISRIR